jgi:hypothetical protein
MSTVLDATPATDLPTHPQRHFRRLRIALSISCGVLAVALCVWWAWSYSRVDIVTLGISPGPGYMLASASGELSLAHFRSIEGSVEAGWRAWTYPFDGTRAWENAPSTEFIGLRCGSFFVAVRYGIVVALTTALAAIPWTRWQFSLRTMFIATTLFALALGLVCHVLV